jgi:hypothetical protein
MRNPILQTTHDNFNSCLSTTHLKNHLKKFTFRLGAREVDSLSGVGREAEPRSAQGKAERGALARGEADRGAAEPWAGQNARNPTHAQ